MTLKKNAFQGTMGCTPNSVPMVFIVFSRDSWGYLTHKNPLYRPYIGISHRGTLVGVYIYIHIPLSVEYWGYFQQSCILRAHNSSLGRGDDDDDA